jgi:hypothetical protein
MTLPSNFPMLPVTDNWESPLSSLKLHHNNMDHEIKWKMDNGAHTTDSLPNMLYLENEYGDEPEWFNRSGFTADVDNVNGYDEYIGAELMFNSWGMMIGESDQA